MTRRATPEILSCDEFLAGPDRHSLWLEGEVDHLYRVNDIHERLVCEILDEHPAERATEVPLGPVAGAQGFTIGEHAEGIILRCPKGRIAGVYLGLDLAIHPQYRRRGLGVAMIAARFLLMGDLPGWALDPPLYTRAGLAAHRAAWRSLQEPMLRIETEMHIAAARGGGMTPASRSPAGWISMSCHDVGAQA